MKYADTNAGRVQAEASGLGRVGDDATFWTCEAVEERLIETVRCWWRMPGGGRWPFASDGPWHLIRKEWEDWDARDPKPMRSLPLRRAEVTAMEEATEWITWVPEDKRRVLVLALGKKAQGMSQVPWRSLLRTLGHTIGAGGLEWRYSQAIQLIANVLNALSSNPYAPKGVRVRYSKAVLEIVERVKMAENRAGSASSPVISS
ncbi:MAG TPA: hypothetical protein VGO55_03135 [Allosphingosinicella sp.]|jgi:hypothetical protein|nr:hypothetical protein [Allosphingosinicella sp.]